MKMKRIIEIKTSKRMKRKMLVMKMMNRMMVMVMLEKKMMKMIMVSQKSTNQRIPRPSGFIKWVEGCFVMGEVGERVRVELRKVVA